MNTLTFNFPVIKWPRGDQLIIDRFQELCIYEAIDNKFMHGFITVIDPATLTRMVVGGEKISVKFESEFEDGKLERDFIIYGKTNEAVTERGIRALKLLFISEEALKASAITLNRRWEKTIPGIVDDIMQQLPLSQQGDQTKTFDFDDTSQIFKYIAPNISADEVMDQLLPLCYDDEGYPYVLYENIDGINMKSFKKLLEQYEEDNVFVYDNLYQIQSSVPLEQRAITIQNLQVFRSFDLRSLIRRGALSAKVTGYDFLNREFIDTDFDIQSRNPYDGDLSFQQFDDPTVETYSQSGMGERIFLPISEDAFMNDLSQNLLFKRAVANLGSSIRVQFEQINSVYFHKAGDCVNLEFDNEVIRVGSANQGNELGQKLSGRYLITRVAHKFQVVNSITYNKAVEAIKLGYGESV